MNELVDAVVVEVMISLSSRMRAQKTRMVKICTVVAGATAIEVMIYPSSLLKIKIIILRRR